MCTTLAGQALLFGLEKCVQTRLVSCVLPSGLQRPCPTIPLRSGLRFRGWHGWSMRCCWWHQGSCTGRGGRGGRGGRRGGAVAVGRGKKATSPLHSRGSPAEGDKIRIGCLTAVTSPPGTTIDWVRITKSMLCDKDPCVWTDVIAEKVRRSPNITAFHVQPTLGDYGSFVDSLATRMPSDHSRIHTHYMAAHPMDADPPHQPLLRLHRPQTRHFQQGGLVQGRGEEEVVLLQPSPIKGTDPPYLFPS